MSSGSDLVLQRQARTVEQLRLKTVHEQKMLQMQIGQNGCLETKSRYELKMLKKQQIKMQRDFDYLRLRAARTVRWTEILEREDREKAAAAAAAEQDAEDNKYDVAQQLSSITFRNSNKTACTNGDEMKKPQRVKIKMASKRMAKLHHRYSKDLKRAQEDSQEFIQTIPSTRDKRDTILELEDLFRPKSAKTCELLRRKQEREKELVTQAKRIKRKGGSTHSKPRYKELTLAEIDFRDIRNKIENRFQRIEKTMANKSKNGDNRDEASDNETGDGDGEASGTTTGSLTQDREEIVFTPIFGDGTLLPRIRLDLSKIRGQRGGKISKPSHLNKIYSSKPNDVIDGNVARDKPTSKSSKTKKTGNLGNDGNSNNNNVDDEEVETPSGDWSGYKLPDDFDPNNPSFFNADGTIRAVYRMPEFAAAFMEAKKARYLRKKGTIAKDVLDFDAIFDRKGSDYDDDVIEEEDEEIINDV